MSEDATGPIDSGDDAARCNLPWLVLRHRPALVRYFMRHLQSREDAEDLAQDTLVRLAQKFPKADIANIEAYLFRIASNLLRDRYRRDRSHHAGEHIPFDNVPDGGIGEAPSTEHVYEDRERLQVFLQALDALPPRCRQVFLLQRYEGLTYSAIAKRLQISVSGVEKHMMRALLHLDARLGER